LQKMEQGDCFKRLQGSACDGSAEKNLPIEAGCQRQYNPAHR
jgi:hypothetical protein